MPKSSLYKNKSQPISNFYNNWKSPEKIELELLVKSINTCRANIIAYLTTIDFTNIGIDNLPNNVQLLIKKLNTRIPIAVEPTYHFFGCCKKSMRVNTLLDNLTAEFEKYDSKLKNILTPHQYNTYANDAINEPLARSGECRIS